MAERILIADDDPVQRRLVENMVTRFGYETVVVDGGDAALTALADTSAPIDGVVLDLVMPDLDGLGVLAKMRERDIRIPVIVQTAHGGIDNVVSAMRAGAIDFVVKPASAERLQVSLRNALATRALEGELTRMKRSRTGTLSFRHGGKKFSFSLSGGFAEILPDRVIIMADTLERPEEIDVQRARLAKDRAEKQLASKDVVNVDQAMGALLRATSRLHVAELK